MINLWVIDFQDLAEEQACLKDVLCKFEKDLFADKDNCIMLPDKAEAVCFNLQEIQDVITELSGKKFLGFSC